MPFRSIDGKIPESQIDDTIARDSEVESAIASIIPASTHEHTNLPLLEKIKIDLFGQLYYENNYDLDALKAGTVFCLLGSLNDESGYSNLVTPTFGQSNPMQIMGLDGKPTLSLITNQTEISIPNLTNLLLNSNGATLYFVFSNGTSGSVENLIKTNNTEDWYRFYGNGHGYTSIFRSTRTENYPLNVPASGNFCVSIHSRSSDFEMFINKNTQGVIGGNFSPGDRFIICPKNYQCLCNLSLLLVIPFFVDKNSLFHDQKMVAIKGRFPSLPFSV